MHGHRRFEVGRLGLDRVDMFDFAYSSFHLAVCRRTEGTDEPARMHAKQREADRRGSQ